MNHKILFVIAISFLAAGCPRGNGNDAAQETGNQQTYIYNTEIVSSDVVMLAGAIDTVVNKSKTAAGEEMLFAASEVEYIEVYDLDGNFLTYATLFKNSYYVSLPKGHNYMLKTKTKGYGTIDAISYNLSDVDTYKNVLDISKTNTTIVAAIKSLYGTDISAIGDIDTVIEGVTNLVESSDIILAGAAEATDPKLIQNALFIKAIDVIITDILWNNYKLEDTYFASNAVLGAENIMAEAVSTALQYSNSYITDASSQMTSAFSPGDIKETFVGNNTVPVARAGMDMAVNLGDSVTLDGSGSYDTDGDALLFYWELFSGEQIQFPSSEATVEITPAVAGTYIFRLYVSDGIAVSTPEELQLTVVDSIAPSVAVTSHTANQLITTSAVTVSGTAYDLSMIAYIQVNGSTAKETGQNFSTWTADIEMEDGFDSEIMVEIADIWGNISSTSVVVDVDASAPSVVITSPQDNQVITQSPVYVTGTASDISQITSVKVNGVSVTSVEGNYAKWEAYVVPVEGLSTLITVETEDEHGNKNTEAAQVSVIFDTSGPDVEITYPSTGAMMSELTMTVSGTSSDVSPIMSFKVNSVDAFNTGSNYSSWTASVNLSEGLNQKITVIAMDAYGNSTTKEITVSVDKTKPTISITYPATGASLYPILLEVQGTSTDNLTGVASITVSEVPAENTGANYSTWKAYVPLLKGTTQTITAVATDAAGNTKSTYVQVTVSSTVSGDISLAANSDIEKMIFDPKRPYIYAVDSGNNTLLFVNTETMSIESQLVVAQGPKDLDIDSSGDKLYIACVTGMEIDEVDLVSKVITKEISVSVYPAAVECGKSGRIFYAKNADGERIGLIDTATGAEIAESEYLGYNGMGLEATADGNNLFVNSNLIDSPPVINYDVSNDTFVQADKMGEIAVYSSGFASNGLFLDEKNGVLYYSDVQVNMNNLSEIKGSLYSDYMKSAHGFNPQFNVCYGTSGGTSFFDGLTLVELKRDTSVPMNFSTYASSFSNDGNFLFGVNSDNTKLGWCSFYELFEEGELSNLGSFERVPEAYSEYNFTQLLADPKRNYIYALSRYQDILAFINTDTMEIDKTIIVGVSPIDMAIDEAGDTLYVSNWLSTHIAAVNLSTKSLADTIVTSMYPCYLTCGKAGTLYYVPNAPFTSGDEFPAQIINTVTKTETGTLSGDLIGNLTTSADYNRLYLADIYGSLKKYNLSSGTAVFEEASAVNLYTYGMNLEVNTAETLIIFGYRAFYTSNINEIAATMTSEIVEITPDGSLAIGYNSVFGTNTFTEIGTLPIPNGGSDNRFVSSPNGSILYIWDYANHKFELVDLTQY